MTNGETKQSHKYHYMAVFTGIATCLGVATVFNCAGIFFPYVTAVANSIWGFIIQLSGSYTMMWAVGLALVVLCLLLAFYALHVGKKMSAK